MEISRQLLGIVYLSFFMIGFVFLTLAIAIQIKQKAKDKDISDKLIIRKKLFYFLAFACAGFGVVLSLLVVIH